MKLEIKFMLIFRRLLRNGASLLRGHPETWRHLRFELYNRPLIFGLRHLQRRAPIPGLVSIITPSCGRLMTLKEAIASVDAQSYPHWEHLIVSDGVFPALRQLASANGEPRRRFFSTPPIRHFGNHQRNVGIFQARGEYLVFLDDDNILYPQALSSMLTGFASGDVGLVFCPIDYDHAKHGVHGQVLMPKQGFACGEVDSLNAMLKRTLAVRCGGWSDSYFADFHLLHEAATMAMSRYLHCPPIGHHR
jgi:cellulose synthase/poly-beta-1,6-N-acetylglucosamine synthase-like glycosyltransferase